MAFARLEEGYDSSMKEYHRKQVSQLNTLISMLVGQLTPGDRQKIMTICTIDVHARDVVAKIIAQKVRKQVVLQEAQGLAPPQIFLAQTISFLFEHFKMPIYLKKR